MTTDEFVNRAKRVWGDRFDYSKTDIKNKDEKGRVLIICKEHGEFWQAPYSHLYGYMGCPKCKWKHSSLEDFIAEAKKIHGNKYDYSKVVYLGMQKKVCIICPEHGEFWQTPSDHIYRGGRGCKLCAGNYKKGTEDFIKESKEIYGELFDYSKTVYNGAHKKSIFICKKHNYEFDQTPDNHLRWNGCPFCKTSKLEKEVRDLLNEHNVIFEEQKTFDWLKYKENMYLDFFVPKYNLAIECQGEQHFETFRFKEDNIETLKKRIDRDKRKFELCKEHGIDIVYFGSNKKYKTCCEQEIVFNKELILDKIYESN